MNIARNEVGIAIKLTKAVLCSALLSIFSASATAAQADAKNTDPAEVAETETGIPVTDKLTIQKCGSCHTPDDKGNLSRISWTRTTPEGWSQAIKRMVRLNGAQLTQTEAHDIIKYLGTHHGLAPEEAKPVMYVAERRMINESIPNETLRQTCAACHSFGQPLSWRRTKREWALLQNMHAALYATAADIAFARNAPPPPGTPPPPPGATTGADGKPLPTQGDVALEYLVKNAGLHTPEWAAWQPRINAPQLSGKWVVVASVPGKGRYVGEMIVSPGSAADEFTTATTLRSVVDGSTVSRKGKGIVFAGYSWRGSSDGGAAKTAAPDALTSAGRETLWFAPDKRTAEGRWYWGEYQEFGFDVKLIRAGSDTILTAVEPHALKAGSKGVDLHVHGAGLPAKLAAQDIDLGSGVKVRKIASVKPGELVVTVDVDASATPGIRDVAVQGALLPQALPVYTKVDYIKVAPDNALAHLGGIKYAKGYIQFDALGYANGPDGKPGTADDIALGTIDASWGVEEFVTVYNDDDTQYVGKLGTNGLFTPNVEGPNPQRPFVGFQGLAAVSQKYEGPKGSSFGRDSYDGRNNYGEILVVATAKRDTDKFGKPLSARSHLVVGVPQYRRWDQPEVSK